jgi:chromate transporter
MPAKKQKPVVRLSQLFAAFFKIGLFTFGGGYAMIPLMEREIIHKHQWLDDTALLDYFAISQSLPGAFSLNVSSFVGMHVRGKRGAILATLGCILPSFTIILLIAAGLAQFQQQVMVQRFFVGIRAAVTAQILVVALKMGRKVVVDWPTAVLAMTAFALVLVIDLHPILTVIGGALVGLIVYWFFPGPTGQKTQPGRQRGEG